MNKTLGATINKGASEGQECAWFNGGDEGDDVENQQPRPPPPPRSPLPHTHLPCLVIVFDLTQISAAGLGDPLPRHQVPHHDGRRADLWRGRG